MYVDSILINHKITCGAVMKTTTLPPLSLVWKVRRAMPPLFGVLTYCYQQSLSRCIICQDVCIQ